MNIRKNAQLSLLLVLSSLSFAGNTNTNVVLDKAQEAYDKHLRRNAFRHLGFMLQNLPTPIAAEDVRALLNQAISTNLLYGDEISFLLNELDSVNPQVLQQVMIHYAEAKAAIKEKEMRQAARQLLDVYKNNTSNLDGINASAFNKTMSTLSRRMEMRNTLQAFDLKIQKATDKALLQQIIQAAKNAGVLYGDDIAFLIDSEDNLNYFNEETIKELLAKYFDDKIAQKELEIAQAISSLGEVIQTQS